MLKQYYYLTKPGIIYGNVITALGGFFLAAKGEVNFQLLIAMVFGLSFVIASACVINNIFDKEMDAKMERTKHRATVTGKISRTKATIFAVILLGLGIYFLQPTTYALFTSLVGWLVYVAFYTPFKSKTVHATLIGSIAGATPPVVGYTAVTNQVDLGAILLFYYFSDLADATFLFDFNFSPRRISYSRSASTFRKKKEFLQRN